MKRFKNAVCGGTFDYLHTGHKQFLQFVAQNAQRILIGLTNDQYVASFKNLHGVRSYGIRKKELEEFVDSTLSDVFIQIEPIHDLYGSTMNPLFSADAIFVTQETRRGAELINKKRQENGMQHILVVEFPIVLAQDSEAISSTRIRNGEINREGIVFLQNELLNKTMYLPQELRPQLQKPFGALITDFNKWVIHNKIQEEKTITVGDVITKTFREKGYNQKISIVDFYVERRQQFTDLFEVGFKKNFLSYFVDNKAGTISSQLLQIIHELSHTAKDKPVVIKVNGEEDLSVIPVVLAFPLGFRVFYGQPGKGVVRVDITEEVKEKAYNIVQKFES